MKSALSLTSGQAVRSGAMYSRSHRMPISRNDLNGKAGARDASQLRLPRLTRLDRSSGRDGSGGDDFAGVQSREPSRRREQGDQVCRRSQWAAHDGRQKIRHPAEPGEDRMGELERDDGRDRRRQPQPEGDGCERECEVANLQLAMRIRSSECSGRWRWALRELRHSFGMHDPFLGRLAPIVCNRPDPRGVIRGRRRRRPQQAIDGGQPTGADVGCVSHRIVGPRRCCPSLRAPFNRA